MESIVQCPKCTTRLKLPPSSKGGVCPRCHTPVMVASTPGAPPPQPKPPEQFAVSTAGSKPPIPVRPSSAAVSQSVIKLGFIAYLQSRTSRKWNAKLLLKNNQVRLGSA